VRGNLLLHVYHYGEIHASAIAQDYRMAVNPVKGQLDRFERSGILVSKEAGRARIYSFNPKSVFLAPVKVFLKIVHDTIPLKERSPSVRIAFLRFSLQARKKLSGHRGRFFHSIPAQKAKKNGATPEGVTPFFNWLRSRNKSTFQPSDLKTEFHYINNLESPSEVRQCLLKCTRAGRIWSQRCAISRLGFKGFNQPIVDE
jgi:hypothetical protein